MHFSSLSVLYFCPSYIISIILVGCYFFGTLRQLESSFRIFLSLFLDTHSSVVWLSYGTSKNKRKNSEMSIKIMVLKHIFYFVLTANLLLIFVSLVFWEIIHNLRFLFFQDALFFNILFIGTLFSHFFLFLSTFSSLVQRTLLDVMDALFIETKVVMGGSSLPLQSSFWID